MKLSEATAATKLAARHRLRRRGARGRRTSSSAAASSPALAKRAAGSRAQARLHYASIAPGTSA